MAATRWSACAVASCRSRVSRPWCARTTTPRSTASLPPTRSRRCDGCCPRPRPPVPCRSRWPLAWATSRTRQRPASSPSCRCRRPTPSTCPWRSSTCPTCWSSSITWARPPPSRPSTVRARATASTRPSRCWAGPRRSKARWRSPPRLPGTRRPPRMPATRRSWPRSWPTSTRARCCRRCPRVASASPARWVRWRSTARSAASTPARTCSPSTWARAGRAGRLPGAAGACA